MSIMIRVCGVGWWLWPALGVFLAFAFGVLLGVDSDDGRWARCVDAETCDNYLLINADSKMRSIVEIISNL